MPPKTSGKAAKKSGKAQKAIAKGDKKKRKGKRIFREIPDWGLDVPRRRSVPILE